jgi:hypothetical protein
MLVCALPYWRHERGYRVAPSRKFVAVVLWGAIGSDGSKALAQKGRAPANSLSELRHDGETGRNGHCRCLVLNSGSAKPALEASW